MAAPANDNLANAITLAAGTTQVTGNNSEATAESGEPRGTGSATKTVWYRWVAPADGTIQVDTIGSSFDTFLTIYKSTGPSFATSFSELLQVTSNDDGGGNSTSLCSFSVQQYRTYYFQVDGYSASYSGSFKLNYPSPSATSFVLTNDNLADALVLGTGTSSVLGNTYSATNEAGERKGSGSSTSTDTAVGFKTVWVRWRAPDSVSGPMTFTTAGSDFDTYLTMWKAKSGVADPITAVTDLDCVASDDDAPASAQSEIIFTPTAATYYYFQVTGYDAGRSGWYKFNYPSPGAEPGGGGATPSGISAATGVGSPSSALNRAAAPNGLSIPAVLGNHNVSLTPTPNGLAVARALGAPSASLNRTAAANGQVVPVSVGSPTAAVNRSTAPAGIAVAMAVGSSGTTATQSAAPAGVAAPVAVGSTSAPLLGAAPSGLAVLAVLGSPTGSGINLVPAGIATPTAIGSPTTALTLTTAPSGLAALAAVGSPSPARNGAAPTGLAVPAALGAPTGPGISLVFSGLVVPVVVGASSTTLNRSTAPSGVAVQVSVGQQGGAIPNAVPTGIAIPVAAGGTASSLDQSASPTGVIAAASVGGAVGGSVERRRPGVFTTGTIPVSRLTAGTTRSRLIAGTSRGPDYS